MINHKLLSDIVRWFRPLRVQCRRAATATLVALIVASPCVAQNTNQPGAAPRPRQSWTSDRRDFVVGDIITVLVDERTMASAARSNSAQDARSRALGLDVQQNLAPTSPSPNVKVSASNDGKSKQQGEESRSNRFVAEISVRVVAVDSSGLLEVKGTKSVALDKNSEELQLSGRVRAEDVSTKNTVESWRLADAKLVHTTKGGLTKPKGHLLLRILGALWP